MHPLIGPFEPPAIPLGPVTIHSFGILVALGFVFGSALAQRKAQRFGGSAESINQLVGWLVLGVFVGGHLGDVLFYRPAELAKDPMLLFRVWQGLSSFGGFVVCTALTVWFFWKEKLDFWRHADALAIGLTLGWFLGRTGCFSAHDHPGNQTDFWLGVYGMCPGHNPAIACHDLGLYEAIWSLAMFAFFMVLDSRPRFPGIYVGLLAAIYGPSRLAMDYFRNPSVDTRYLGLTPAQYGSIALFAIGLWILRRQSGKTPTWGQQGQSQ